MLKDKESPEREGLSQEVHHIEWLQSLGFDIESLSYGEWKKHPGKDASESSGSYACVTYRNKLDKGGFGLVTLAEIHGARQKPYKTLPERSAGIEFSLSGFSDSLLEQKERSEKKLVKEAEQQEKASRVAYGVWKNSDIRGISDYLIRKGVGSYGIRFRENEHGHVAVVPMFDIKGRLWNYQFLNPNGEKKSPTKGGRIKGLFHCIGSIVDGQVLGIAESYTTGATCYELSGVPVACCFGCDNMATVARELNKKYPRSPIIVFADNDHIYLLLLTS